MVKIRPDQAWCSAFIHRTHSAFAQVLDNGLLITAEHHPLLLRIALIGIHRIVILIQQALDPGSVQIDLAGALLDVKRLPHQIVKPLMALATKALANTQQAA